jgi:hypothetical protein
MFACNFEKTTKTSTRRPFTEMQEVKARAGKRNKTERKGSKRDYLENDE